VGDGSVVGDHDDGPTRGHGLHPGANLGDSKTISRSEAGAGPAASTSANRPGLDAVENDMDIDGVATDKIVEHIEQCDRGGSGGVCGGRAAEGAGIARNACEDVGESWG
jgi:hypothetical protein